MAHLAEAPGKSTAPPADRPARPDVRPDDQTQEQTVPPYRVILHNDDVNVFEDVVRYVHRLTPLSLKEAEQRTREADERGRSILLSTHRERAELYEEQFTSVGLTVSIESDA